MSKPPSYIAVRSAGLLIPSGSVADPDRLHFHAILTNVCSKGRHLIGPIGTIYKDQFHDDTCVIGKGEHPFIKHPSYFIYRRLTILDSAHITRCIDGWVYKKQPNLSAALIKRICEGISKSDFTPGFAEEYWDENES